MDNPKKDNRAKILVMAIAISLLVAIISTSYAYFTISNKTGSEETITSGTMALTLHDGAKVETGFMIPGEYIEKTFYVTNTGNLATSYDIYLSEVINDFADKTDLVYTLTSNDGGYSTSGQVQVPSTETKIVDSQAIGTSTTHHYTLRITFLNKNEAQDDNQGKHFSGKLQINEYQAANNGGGNQPTEEPELIDGSWSTPGSEVDLGGERFYVISSDSTTVRLLAKYNLDYVDSDILQSSESSLTTSFYDLNNDPDIDWDACNDGGGCYEGYWVVSVDPEWASRVCLKEEYGGDLSLYSGSEGCNDEELYPAYVVDTKFEGSSYLQSYRTYLTGLGYGIEDIGLVNNSDLSAFSCVLDVYGDSYCNASYTWLYDQSYWTGLAIDNRSVITFEDTRSYYDNKNFISFSDFGNGYGVRPVITVNIPS